MQATGILAISLGGILALIEWLTPMIGGSSANMYDVLAEAIKGVVVGGIIGAFFDFFRR